MSRSDYNFYMWLLIVFEFPVSLFEKYYYCLPQSAFVYTSGKILA